MAAGWEPERSLCCLPAQDQPCQQCYCFPEQGAWSSCWLSRAEHRLCGRELHRGRSSRHLHHHLQLLFLLPKTLYMRASCPGGGAGLLLLAGLLVPQALCTDRLQCCGSHQSRDCETKGLWSAVPMATPAGVWDQAGHASQGQLNAARLYFGTLGNSGRERSMSVLLLGRAAPGEGSTMSSALLPFTPCPPHTGPALAWQHPARVEQPPSTWWEQGGDMLPAAGVLAAISALFMLPASGLMPVCACELSPRCPPCSGLFCGALACPWASQSLRRNVRIESCPPA